MTPSSQTPGQMRMTIGAWTVDPSLNQIRNGSAIRTLEPKVMDVCVCLARHAGEAVSKEQLIAEVWQGAFVGDDVIVRAISELRKALGDDARNPGVIQTVPKRGYRLLAPVRPAVHHVFPSTRFKVAAFALLLPSAAVVWLLAFARGADTGVEVADRVQTGCSPAVSPLLAEATKFFQDSLSTFEGARAPLQRVVSSDPGCAAAYVWLAWTYPAGPEQRALILRAKASLGRASEPEHFWVKGSDALMSEDWETAVDAYRAMVKHLPGDYWAWNNMAVAYGQLARLDEAASAMRRAADARPERFAPQALAAVFLQRAGRTPEASDYSRRAAVLMRAGSVNDQEPRLVEFIRFYPIFERWLNDDVTGIERELVQHRARLASLTDFDRVVVLEPVTSWLRALGRLRDAERLTLSVKHSDGLRAGIEWERRDLPAMRRSLLAYLEERDANWFAPISLLARAGLLKQAEAELARPGPGVGSDYLIPSKWVEGQASVHRADVLLARGRDTDAIPLLDSAFRALHGSGWGEYYGAATRLSAIRRARNEAARALWVLEEAGQERSRVYGMGVAASEWTEAQGELATVYRLLGRSSDADRVEARLRKLLANADADHAVAAALTRHDNSN